MSSILKALDLKMEYNKCVYIIGNILLRKGNYLEGLKKIKEGEGVIKFNLEKGIFIN